MTTELPRSTGTAPTANAIAGAAALAQSSGRALLLPRIEAVADVEEREALLALEVDRFALIGHLHGPDGAEVIVRQLEASLQATLRAGDRMLRSGRGQCAVLLAGDADDASEFVRTAVAAFQRKSWPDLGQVTVSAGAALRYPDESTADWWSRVDSALAQAKAGVGGLVVIDRRRSASDASTQAPGLHLQWQTRFECGEPTIDRQHRELFERSEEILEASRHGSARVVDELERLMAEILTHFADEERLLEQRAYAGLAAHRRSHASLASRALGLQAAAAAGTATREQLTRFLLGDIVADHMLTEDLRFASLFAKAHSR